ncbi:hypothetical protein OIU74_023089 [Salix koriyanagi]|uniref:Uncharacterized protein n=1 Tax=Salix koriyanagi TaxID=2511006 RepID=A0A9Q1AAF0_9ROSI|nr:hypothetical protein OIU74_023089 [Salix koriyanagi]
MVAAGSDLRVPSKEIPDSPETIFVYLLLFLWIFSIKTINLKLRVRMLMEAVIESLKDLELPHPNAGEQLASVSPASAKSSQKDDQEMHIQFGMKSSEQLSDLAGDVMKLKCGSTCMAPAIS